MNGIREVFPQFTVFADGLGASHYYQEFNSPAEDLLQKRTAIR